MINGPDYASFIRSNEDNPNLFETIQARFIAVQQFIVQFSNFATSIDNLGLVQSHYVVNRRSSRVHESCPSKASSSAQTASLRRSQLHTPRISSALQPSVARLDLGNGKGPQCINGVYEWRSSAISLLSGCFDCGVECRDGPRDSSLAQ